MYRGTASARAEERAPRAFDAVFLESPEATRSFSHLEIPSFDRDDRVWSPSWGSMHLDEVAVAIQRARFEVERREPDVDPFRQSHPATARVYVPVRADRGFLVLCEF
jgi:hypothetical protein